MPGRRVRPRNAQANVAEAAHPSVFVAGWRPATGWVYAIVLFVWYVPMTLVSIGLLVPSSSQAARSRRGSTSA